MNVMFPKENKNRHPAEPLRSPDGGAVKRVASAPGVERFGCSSTESRLTAFDRGGDGAHVALFSSWSLQRPSRESCC